MRDPLTHQNLFRRDLAVFFVLGLTALAVYWHSLANGFLINWDDPNYVVTNPDAHGFSLEHIKNAFSKFYVGNYAPLHILSYMLDYSLWGLKPFGYILHNLLLHTLNGFLLYQLVRRMSAAVYPSLFSALLFVVHPVQVESVVWISQRKNLLAMFFFLLSFHLYLTYKAGAGGGKGKYYLLSLVFFGSSLLTKSVAVVLPVCLLLYDICMERRTLRQSLPDKIPFIVVAAVTSFLALLSQSEDYGGGGRAAFHGGGPYATFLTMLPVFVTYLRMIFIPTGLSGVYDPALKTSVDPVVAASGGLLLVLAVFARMIFRKERQLFFWLAFAAVGIVPVSQIVPLVTMMNDRYLYFPMAGAAPFIVLGVAKLLPMGRIQVRYWVAGVFCLVLTLYGAMSADRGVVWHDSLTLWSDAVRKNPGNDTAKYNLANVYLESNQLDKVPPIVDQLLLSKPKSARFHELRGHYFYKTGNVEKAEESYKRALELWPRLVNSYFCLGNIFLGKNDLKGAEEMFSAAEKLGSMTPDLSYSIACLESLKGNLPRALTYLDNAFRLGFRECEAVRINDELQPLHRNQEFLEIMTTYCSERGTR